MSIMYTGFGAAADFMSKVNQQCEELFSSEDGKVIKKTPVDVSKEDPKKLQERQCT